MMRFTKAFFGGIFCATLLASPTCSGEESEIYLIQEDWEMVVSEPDAATVSPQVTFFTSPSVNSDTTYFQLQMNYAADDGFSPGGFHVAAVKNGQMVDEARSGTQSVLASNGDVIRWTSVMAVINNQLLYAVTNGHGNEWGAFGGPDYLVTMTSTGMADLSEYNPQQSIDSVDIGFGANRVQSVILRTVRAYYQDGRVVDVPVNLQP
jgi:hypothetical protein